LTDSTSLPCLFEERRGDAGRTPSLNLTVGVFSKE